MRLIALVAYAALSCLVSFNVAAQDYPAKPVRFISPYPPGGVVDIASRLVGNKLSEMWKQQVVVENRTGGGGTIGADYASKAAPDGYTVLFATVSEFCITPHLYSKLPYDIRRDMTPVVIATETPLMLAAHHSAPFSSVKEMIAHSKAAQGGLSYSSPGLGTLNHLTGERLVLETGARLVHVPYKGGGPAGTALAGGEVPLGMLAASSVAPHIKTGRVKGIALINRENVGFDASQWVGVAVPSGTPRAIIGKLNADINAVLKMPDVRERLNGLGSQPAGSTVEEMAARIGAESEQFGQIVRRIKLRLD